MRVLITGATGMVGSELHRQLLERGHEVMGMQRLVGYRNLPDHFLWGDVTDSDSLHAAYEFAPDVVCHLAAVATNSYAILHPSETFRVNAQGTVNMVELCRGMNPAPTFVLASSSEVYGGATVPVTEDSPVQADMAYAAAKIAAEFYVRASGLPFVIMRCFNTFGRALVGAARSVVDEIIVQSLTKGRVTLLSADPQRAFMFRQHHVEAYLAVLANLSIAQGQTYNFGPIDACSIGEIAHAICGSENIPVDFLEQSRPGDIPYLANGSHKAQTELGWKQPDHADLTRGLERAHREWAARLRAHSLQEV